jgi:hypothetical protein
LNDHRFVFVCGLQRSGTTMLYRYLSEHPEISKLEGTDRKGNEGQHNQTVYPDPDRYGRAGGFAFQPEARLTEDSPLVTDANRDKLFGEWARYWDLSRPVLMEKSPPNVIRSRFLQAMFPESSFVFITRHPIAVSSATQKWSDTRPRSLVRHWLEAHRLMLEDIPHLRRAHVLRYEDMVADPDGVLARVFGFLCLEDFDAQRQVAEGINQDNFYADRTLRTGVNDKYFTEWRGPGRRRTLVRRLYYEMVDRSAERAVNRFGYSMLHPERLTTPTVALPGLGSMAAQTARL